MAFYFRPLFKFFLFFLETDDRLWPWRSDTEKETAGNLHKIIIYLYSY